MASAASSSSFPRPLNLGMKDASSMPAAGTPWLQPPDLRLAFSSSGALLRQRCRRASWLVF